MDRLARIRASATFTTVTSRQMMTKPRLVASRARRGDGVERLCMMIRVIRAEGAYGPGGPEGLPVVQDEIYYPSRT